MGDVLQVCYAVVGSGWDRHTQMAWLSATSVRIQEPSAKIIVVLENLSPGTSSEVRTRFLQVADEVIDVSSAVEDPPSKSRFHRIALRGYVSGTVLYVDCDTLAVAPLRDVLQFKSDIAAVLDLNAPRLPWSPPRVQEYFREAGWTLPLPYYCNNGVFLMRDNERSAAFCREWMARWSRPSRWPHTWDQDTFNSTLWATPATHELLPTGFNAMIRLRNYRFRDARLLHFFGSAEEQRGTLMEHLLQTLQTTGQFDENAYRLSLRRRHPWGPSPEAWRLWHSRNYLRALARKLAPLSQ